MYDCKETLYFVIFQRGPEPSDPTSGLAYVHVVRLIRANMFEGQRKMLNHDTYLKLLYTLVKLFVSKVASATDVKMLSFLDFQTTKTIMGQTWPW